MTLVVGVMSRLVPSASVTFPAASVCTVPVTRVAGLREGATLAWDAGLDAAGCAAVDAGATLAGATEATDGLAEVARVDADGDGVVGLPEPQAAMTSERAAAAIV
ncbi:MAG TPA: hypothetical protein VMV93_00525 [Chloroflexota bacterium]|nr:hypothetical protein [Chloroflexota bacterium]